MKTRYVTSIRWKFIYLFAASAFLAAAGVLISMGAAILLAELVDPIRSILRSLASSSLGAFGIMFMTFAFFFILIYLFLSQKVISYIEEISSAVQIISGGNFDCVIPLKSSTELGDLAENINIMAYKLKKSIEEERNAERTKTELITSVSHDLRTPLTSILGYLGLITNDRYKDEVELRYYADIAYSKAQKLKKLIDELFEFTKLNNAGVKPVMGKVNLGELLEQLSEEFVPILDEVGMEYRLYIDKEKMAVQADGDMLVRVYENLISNAIRYGKEGKFIDIEASRQGMEAVVKIRNYGEAIPQNELPYIFERFYRVEKSRSEKTGGTGLGLAIARNILELHGGRITAYSSENSTVFETRMRMI